MFRATPASEPGPPPAAATRRSDAPAGAAAAVSVDHTRGRLQPAADHMRSPQPRNQPWEPARQGCGRVCASGILGGSRVRVPGGEDELSPRQEAPQRRAEEPRREGARVAQTRYRSRYRPTSSSASSLSEQSRTLSHSRMPRSNLIVNVVTGQELFFIPPAANPARPCSVSCRLRAKRLSSWL